MSTLLAAVNFVDKLVLLEDGRELPIGNFYAAAPGKPKLTVKSELTVDDRVDDWEIAEVFSIVFPGVDAAVLVETSSLSFLTGKVN